MSTHQQEHHITPLSTYLKVYGALVILTILTVAVAHINLGMFNTFVALLIATVKVFLVMAFFMHLKAEGKLNRVTIGSAFLFALIFYFLTASDIFTRKNYTEIALPEKIEALKAKKAAEGQAPAEPAAAPEEHK